MTDLTTTGTATPTVIHALPLFSVQIKFNYLFFNKKDPLTGKAIRITKEISAVASFISSNQSATVTALSLT